MQNVVFNENLEAPINKGDVIGSVSYTLNNEIIKTINLIADSNVKRMNLFNMTTNIYENWFKLLR